MKHNMKTQKVGNVGEELASMFLMKHGFKIIERNYRKKWGEIDIVAEKDGAVHFVEVKAISNPNYMPEANVRLWKKQRLSRAIRTYLAERKILENQDFLIDIIAIFLDFERKKARIRITENVIL